MVVLLAGLSHYSLVYSKNLGFQLVVPWELNYSIFFVAFESMHPESVTGLLVKIGVVTTAVMVSFYFHKLCENAICNATSKRCSESLQFDFIEENLGDILSKRLL